MNAEDYMRMAMDEAEKAVSEGNKPFGVIVTNQDGEIVWRDHDRAFTLMDPTAHGEVNAIRHLCKELKTLRLDGYRFYTNAEPCPVCLGSMIRAKVAEVYYGAKTEVTASLPIPAELLAKYATSHKIKIVSGILAGETLAHRIKLLGAGF